MIIVNKQHYGDSNKRTEQNFQVILLARYCRWLTHPSTVGEFIAIEPPWEREREGGEGGVTKKQKLYRAKRFVHGGFSGREKNCERGGGTENVGNRWMNIIVEGKPASARKKRDGRRLGTMDSENKAWSMKLKQDLPYRFEDTRACVSPRTKCCFFFFFLGEKSRLIVKLRLIVRKKKERKREEEILRLTNSSLYHFLKFHSGNCVSRFEIFESRNCKYCILYAIFEIF